MRAAFSACNNVGLLTHASAVFGAKIVIVGRILNIPELYKRVELTAGVKNRVDFDEFEREGLPGKGY